MNFASRHECRKCGAPKPQGGGYAGPPPPGDRDMSMFGGSGGMGGGGKGNGKTKPGDWTCPDCQNHNWSIRKSCNRCNRPKPDNLNNNFAPPPPQADHSSGGGGGGWGCNDAFGGGGPPPPPVREVTGPGGKREEVREGDWNCTIFQFFCTVYNSTKKNYVNYFNLRFNN